MESNEEEFVRPQYCRGYFADTDATHGQEYPFFNGTTYLDYANRASPQFYVESLMVFPINGCAAFKIPEGKRWEVKREGLAWDREWYLVHQRTGSLFKQHEYPQMALIHPSVDIDSGELRITYNPKAPNGQLSLKIPLAWDGMSTNAMSSPVRSSCRPSAYDSNLCLRSYGSPVVSAFFTRILGVSCTLARLSSLDASLDIKTPNLASIWKNRFRKLNRLEPFSRGAGMPSEIGQQYVLVSNEMSVLIVSRSSINRLNEISVAITKRNSGTSKVIPSECFNGNIIVAERISQPARAERPYAEDHWSSVRIGHDQLRFDTVDPCERCQMLCVDQSSTALLKLRRADSRICFGRYAVVSTKEGESSGRNAPGSRSITVGDVVLPTEQDN
ncbi:uncharacterized protein N7446_010744 [Penicillium canescens]|uniref:MOSC domain-containing protein n=1 Tax=Penicillium canescens TaxID=5083 RepID=A0AAD6N8C1_PENCN|nr:uncharacterized protein N7446_010744 [Penicillium canescens]KAJ6041368.1 hypothetical protein N7460_006758 [Penicillium canescens]KAJ6050635.1 hypothetical protein N7446_010744 [Penicillium canescens]KAJ6065858.1 hypothetical protein N7444_001511 [Penicillium canescens]